MSASDRDELLVAIAEKSNVCDPYSLVSGIVRMIAVDRWCNELLRAKLIEYVDGGKAKITIKGRVQARKLRQSWAQ